MRRRSNRYMRPQRAGDGGIPAEKQSGKWIAEGKVKGQSPSIRTAGLR
jgi:hypothetical protein